MHRHDCGRPHHVCVRVCVCVCVCVCVQPGMTVGVLDMGAGTVDLSVHLVDQRGPLPVLSDLVHGRGYALGSAYIDQELR